MLIFVHLLVGAALGKYISNIYALIIIAFLSHYLLDAIPHYQWGPVENYLNGGIRGMNKKDFFLKVIEPLLGISVTLYFIIQNHSLAMFIGAWFSWFPDFLVFLSWKKIPPFTPLREFEKKWHRHTGLFIGIITQLIVIAIALYFLV